MAGRTLCLSGKRRRRLRCELAGGQRAYECDNVQCLDGWHHRAGAGVRSAVSSLAVDSVDSACRTGDALGAAVGQCGRCRSELSLKFSRISSNLGGGEVLGPTELPRILLAGDVVVAFARNRGLDPPAQRVLPNERRDIDRYSRHPAGSPRFLVA